ncbi:CAP domain-containing protein [Danxiaibacter flavus]|uniref:CAP domain-containing protein n=1 Tax=Danxiaibacter flavus TaxID=3049108 RepID=A0ABV3ZMF1_9BACT|nr:CAP domain-containing protein [Chitinophagaceae bacterium DXS]
MMRYFVNVITVAFFSVLLFSCSKRHHPAKSNNPSSVTVTPSGGSSSSDNSAPDMSTMNNDILTYINQYRTSLGKTPLKMVQAASTEATKHSSGMASGKVAFGHDGMQIRVTNVARQIGRISAAAENVAHGKLNARQVVDGWLNSPGHKKNIEGNYTLTGIGVAQGNRGEIFFTQLFLRK